MNYNNNIPQAGDKLKDSQPQIRDNFSSLDTYLNINHVAFTDANFGKHKWVNLIQPVSPTSLVGEAVLYAKQADSQSEIYFRQDGSTDEYRLTRAIHGATPMARFGQNVAGYVADHSGGWTFLPGGLILNYGSFTATGGSTGTITFAQSFPSGNPPFSINITPLATNSGSTVVVRNNVPPSSSQFNWLVDFTAGLVKIYWMAIGN